MDDNGWLGRFVMFFGPFVAAWSAFLAFLVHLKKIRNAETGAAHSRLMAEIDHLTSERDVTSEERDLVRDRWAECERTSNERLARAVIAEATLITRDKEAGRPTFLPGGEDLERKPNGGEDG